MLLGVRRLHDSVQLKWLDVLGGIVGGEDGELAMSHPSRADAMAEKYGAPV